MAIKQRELPQIDWTHKITSKDFEARFAVRAEKIIATTPNIHWAMRHRFDKVREICSQRGYELQALRKTKGKQP
jgi:hypothetical protein